ncbi:phospholipase D-like domain-containing protein [Nostoc sp. ChiQUE01b]|uniref:phospholipase D-like domain-containing protein n=1 Tax=Nostoc sp. ChiQUE01b TaxID=3075376 RepID=UPI002AD4CDAF|nr:phospholipase D-like domain-containing protein [Nostoc sp. ChiQUE01b]MDZ8257572.1 phospholipase D-like domain-containing protein [Nostoc sp. ChiQUE01b]
MSSKLIYHTNESINGGISPFDKAIHQVSNNSKELLIACPYIDVSYIKTFLHKPGKWRIISDVEAWLNAFQDKAREEIINFIIGNKYKIHHYINLHTKVILGDHLCLVGSANLTAMGITQRAEMSILLDESNHINEIREWFEHSWSSSGEINIPELKDYIKRNTTIIPRIEEQDSYLNSDAPIIRSKMITQPKKSEKKASKSNAKTDNEPWNGCDFYVSIGEGKHRNWEDCRKYGFISSGSEKKFNKGIIKLLPGSRVFVHIPKTGYVGVGLVKDSAVPLKDFKLLFNGQQVPILDVQLFAPEMDEYVDDLDKSEYLVRVEWIKAVPRSQAYWEKGFFSYKNIKCKMESQKARLTIERVSQHFGL